MHKEHSLSLLRINLIHVTYEYTRVVGEPCQIQSVVHSRDYSHRALSLLCDCQQCV